MKHKSFIIKPIALALGFTCMFGINQVEASTPYEIKQGDTLYNIAQENDVTVAQLKQLNNLTSSLIYSGHTLSIPSTITIIHGDTLYSIAKKYNSTVSQLKHINQLSSNMIFKGQKLIIPTNVTVKKGDTLYSIARNYGLSVSELKSLNYLSSNTIKVGQLLNVAAKTRVNHHFDASHVELSVKLSSDFTFDAEEPRRYLLQYTDEDAYFSRVEVLDSQTKLPEIKENSKAYLKGNTIKEIPINNDFPEFYRNAAFFLHGYTNKTQTAIVVKKVDGVLIRFTIHYLNKEESEEITPQMIDILQTIKIKK
ncbi:peptidoglycan endopeptidase LytE [Metabacillus crassostreae]|uniref:LysM peptidoglycan-binding domain-containing protein n=1 Tax=Metabacillus crassostreae TaxID=929098 RepID=UPI00195C5BA5|nr:LysM peptidoglycan-binding domain-containing protein [Metabacillus crassostreae]MBM7605513.1 peptidoglycan endopeptidase LytE [Metabacillus crassostreae]